MPHAMVVRGQGGEIRWGYYRAAELGAWTLDANHLSASIVAQDAYRIAQAPLTFIVRRPNGAHWAWALETPSIVDRQLTAQIRTEES